MDQFTKIAIEVYVLHEVSHLYVYCVSVCYKKNCVVRRFIYQASQKEHHEKWKPYWLYPPVAKNSCGYFALSLPATKSTRFLPIVGLWLNS